MMIVPGTPSKWYAADGVPALVSGSLLRRDGRYDGRGGVVGSIEQWLQLLPASVL